MSESVQMPALGESVTEGTVTQWLKSVGDEVEVDEPLLEVSTDKVDTEIPSPVAGVLEKILVEEDETVEVGAELAIIGTGEGSSGEDDGGAAANEEASQSSGQDPAESAAEPAEEPEQPEEAAADSKEESLSPAEAAQAQGGGQSEESSDDADSGSDDSGSDDSGDSGSDDSGAGDSGSGSSDSGERTAVNLPELGESVTEGTVTQWLKSVGDEVAVDEPLLEISTDKVDTEIPSPVAGTLLEIVVEEDETVEVGSPLAYVGSGSPSSSSGSADAGSADTDSDSTGSSDTPGHDTGADADGGDSQPAEATPQPSGGSDAAEAEGESSSQAQIPEDATDEQTESADSEPGGAPSAGQSGDSGSSDSGKADSGKADAGSGDAGSSDDEGPVAYVTPLVRKLAADKGVDLGELEGSGVGGRIRKQDVLAAAEAAEKAKKEAEEKASAPKEAAPAGTGSPKESKPAEVSPLRGTREKMSRLRKIVAERMVESLQVSAQLTTVVEVDVTKVARLRARAKEEFNRREGAKLTFLPFFTLAATEALKAHPKLNASIDGNEVVYHGSENLGIAVDTERGLVVPVIKDAGDLNIAGISRKIADLASRTRANKITPDELGGGTFTLTNTGSGGALFDTPILLQPQVGILGIGTIVKRPVVVDVEGSEVIAVRSMVYLALSYDHRLVDGADAARFLTTMKNRLEEGAFESDLGL